MEDEIYDLREHIGADKLYVVLNENKGTFEKKTLLLPTVSAYMKDIKSDRTRRRDLVVSRHILNTEVEPRLHSYLQEAEKEEAEIERIASLMFHNHDDYITLCGRQAREYNGILEVRLNDNRTFGLPFYPLGRIITIIEDKKSLDDLFM